MSLLVLENSTSKSNTFDRDLAIVHCVRRRQCNTRDMKDIELYNTLLLRISEVLVFLITVVLNGLLVTALCKGRSRYAVGAFEL